MRDVVICHSTALLSFIVWDNFVVIFRVLGYNVPRVEQAREIAQHAKDDVDQRVGGAEACFDPDCMGLSVRVCNVD